MRPFGMELRFRRGRAIGEAFLYTGNAVTVTIGGIPAAASLAGLTSSIPTRYEVNAVVPAGVAPGHQIRVVLTVAGQISPPVTMAVQ